MPYTDQVIELIGLPCCGHLDDFGYAENLVEPFWAPASSTYHACLVSVTMVMACNAARLQWGSAFLSSNHHSWEAWGETGIACERSRRGRKKFGEQSEQRHKTEDRWESGQLQGWNSIFFPLTSPSFFRSLRNLPSRNDRPEFTVVLPFRWMSSFWNIPLSFVERRPGVW